MKSGFNVSPNAATGELVRSAAEGRNGSHTCRSAGDVTPRATAIAESVIITRDLINTPPNDLYPASFAERARKLAEANGLEFEVLDEKALKRKEKAKGKSEKEWKDREDAVVKGKQMKDKKREANLKARSDGKGQKGKGKPKGKSGGKPGAKKGGRPGFEGKGFKA